MTIAFVRSATGGGSASATTLVIPFNATGCDAIVVAARDVDPTLITGVTYNGVALTLKRHDGSVGGRGASVYVGVGPATGTNNVVISFSGSQNLAAIVSGWSGVDQTTPVGNVAGNSTGAGTPFAQAIAVTAGNVAVDFYILTKGDSTVAPTPSGTQTLVTSFLDTANYCYHGMSYLLNATSMAWAWNGPTAQAQSLSVIELRAGTASTVTGVTVSPATATVAGGASQTFTATVAGTGGPSQAVNWTTTAGSITAGGVFTAPAATGAAQTVTVTATSVQDGTKSGTATVTVPSTSSTVTGVTVSPATATVVGGASQTFTATVAGTGGPSQAVNWTTNLGTITAGGIYTAPAATASAQTATVTATSAQNGAFAGTATVTIPLSSGPALSAAFLNVFGQSLNYADRTKDSSSTTGTGTVTITGTAPTAFQAFATAFPVGAKRICYTIAEQSGAAWETGLGTLVTATTLSRDTVFSSSSAGALVNFGAGVKDVFCDVSAAAVKRMAVKSYIDLRDYAVDPTFTTDSTAGIQAAINDAWISGVETIRVPEGRYKIAGALQSTDVTGRPANGQLIIPASPFNTSMRHIKIIGEGATSWQFGAINDEPIQTRGVIFESTLAGVTDNNAALIHAAVGYDGGFGVFNFTDVTIENVCIRTSTTSGPNSLGGINLVYLANGGFLHNVKVEVNRGLRTNPDPTGYGSFGIVTAPTNNSAAFRWGTVFIGGYASGIKFSEHMHIDRLMIQGCTNGVILGDTYHASSITHCEIDDTKNNIVTSGNHALAILCYASEHDTPGTFFDFAKDILLAPGVTTPGTRKVTILQSTVVVGGLGVSDSNWSASATIPYKVVAGAGAN